jgi:hypothetical protein
MAVIKRKIKKNQQESKKKKKVEWNMNGDLQ